MVFCLAYGLPIGSENTNWHRRTEYPNLKHKELDCSLPPQILSKITLINVPSIMQSPGIIFPSLPQSITRKRWQRAGYSGEIGREKVVSLNNNDRKTPIKLVYSPAAIETSQFYVVGHSKILQNIYSIH